MNNNATFNFISQLKIKELNIINIEKISKKLKILNDISLRVYQAHILKIKMADETNQQRIDDETLLKIYDRNKHDIENVMTCNMKFKYK